MWASLLKYKVKDTDNKDSSATSKNVVTYDPTTQLFIQKEIESKSHDSILPTMEEISASKETRGPSSASKEIKERPTASKGTREPLSASKETKESSSAPKSSVSTHPIRLTQREPRPFPLPLILDQEQIKHALLLAACHPHHAISVLISGGRGTGKSVLARSMQKIVPSCIRRVKGSLYNVDSEGREGVDSFLLEELWNEFHVNSTNVTSTAKSQTFSISQALSSRPTELIPTPFVQIPLGTMQDSLLGTIDLERSLETGTTLFSPGLLAKAHRGILYIDEINLLEDEVMDVLMKVLSEGEVRVEREGLSVHYPCKPLVIGTYNPEEGECREHLLDRFGIVLSAGGETEEVEGLDSLVGGSEVDNDSNRRKDQRLSIEQRVQVVENVMGFEAGAEQTTKEAEERLRKAEVEEQNWRTKVELARGRMAGKLKLDGTSSDEKESKDPGVGGIQLSSDQILYLCKEATRAGCEGQRAEIFAAEIAKASAALEGRTEVQADDLMTGVILAILPRATVMPGETADGSSGDYDSVDSRSPPPPPSEVPPIMAPPPPMDDKQEESGEEEQEEGREEDHKMEEMKDNDEQDEEEDIEHHDEEMAIPEQFMFGVKHVKVDPELLKFTKWTRKGRGGKRAKIFSLLRGRFVKAIFPKGGKYRLAVGATLRAAAPHQLSRRKRAINTPRQNRPVIVEKDDFRVKQMSRKAGTLVIFLIDGSGSMALNRMNAAKGAAIDLLSEAYKSRDKIALICFHDTEAEVMVPPTKSIALTKNRLESMPCGGGSPLAHGLTLAVRMGLNTMKIKQDVGRVVLVCITDGRANIPLELSTEHVFTASSDPNSKEGMPSRKFLKDEVLACAKSLASLKDFDFVCIDTEDEFIGTGIAREMTAVAGGKYFHMDSTDAVRVAQITRQNIKRRP